MQNWPQGPKSITTSLRRVYDSSVGGEGNTSQGQRDSAPVFRGFEEYPSILSEDFSLIRETQKTRFGGGNIARGRQGSSRGGGRRWQVSLGWQAGGPGTRSL